MTHAEVAAAVSAAAGKPVKYSPLSLDQWRDGLAAANLPRALVDVIMRSQRAGAEGAFDLVSGDIARLTGRQARSAIDFVSSVLVPAVAVS